MLPDQAQVQVHISYGDRDQAVQSLPNFPTWSFLRSCEGSGWAFLAETRVSELQAPVLRPGGAECYLGQKL